MKRNVKDKPKRKDSRAYAKVIVDIPSRSADRPFDYLIPPELRGKIALGSVVAVPFGPSQTVGYVVELAGKAEVEKVSAINGLLEEDTVFDGTVLELCHWISSYYLCPLGEALRLAIPPGRGRKVVVRYSASDERAAEITAEQDRIVSTVKRLGSATRSQLAAALRQGTLRQLPALVRAGVLLQRYETSAPAAREKTVQYAVLTDEACRCEAELSRAPKQAAIVGLLSEFREMPVATLLAEASASRAALNALEAKGLIRLEARVVFRDVETPEIGRAAAAPEHLTDEQEAALEAVESAREPGAFLLDGVTGSGKTEVYLRVVRDVLARGKGAIVLVPEISLTPQTVSRFTRRLGGTVAVLHSGLSPGERYDEWMALRSGRKRVAVGARSAIFAPIKNLGVIVVDEEHETSYKQNSSPRYNAREVSLERGRIAGCPVMLGTATPSLESLRLVELGKMTHLRLPERVGGRPMPEVQVVDMRTEFDAGNRSIFSYALQQAMDDALEAGEKVVLFLNRRGFSSFLLCRDCGFVPSCPNCAVSLVYHERGRQLRCHHCDAAQNVTETCPSCGSPYLRHFGIGTQRVEDEVKRFHVDVPVIRMDADTTKSKGSHARKLGSFAGFARAVLLGTQMIAKGHDFPEVTVVGVVAADVALGLPDFRAAERTFQLLLQVAGRAGRGDRPGRVIIQTYWPEHYAIEALAKGRPEQFYEQEMTMRRLMDYPPFVPLVNIGFSGPDLSDVRHLAAEARRLAAEFAPGLVDILGPAPAPLEKLAGRYRYHLALKLRDEKRAKEALREALARLEGRRRKGVSIAVDVDPVWMT